MAVIITPFDAAGDLIIIRAQIWGRYGDIHDVDIGIDTGSSETIVTPDITDALGYSARDADKRTIVRSVIGEEPGYLMRVTKFAALGFEFDDFPLHIHDLPEGYGIDGLLGLSFLRNFDYHVRSARGELVVDWTATA